MPLYDHALRFVGFFPPNSEVTALKSKLHEQFEAVLLPQKVSSGWRIDPGRLRECLMFLYYWLPEQEWWRIYGDARQLAKRKNCVVAMGNLNNCQRLWDVNFQSPADLWSVAIFHGGDHRFFLESNIGKREFIFFFVCLSVGLSTGWLCNSFFTFYCRTHLSGKLTHSFDHS